MAEDKADDISTNFDVLDTMREVSDRYVEEHERKVKEINEKIRVLDEDKKQLKLQTIRVIQLGDSFSLLVLIENKKSI